MFFLFFLVHGLSVLKYSTIGAFIPRQINTFQIKIWHVWLRVWQNLVCWFITVNKNYSQNFRFFGPSRSKLWVRDSGKFDRNGPTRMGQKFISQLVWDLETSSIYQIKGIWMIYMGKSNRTHLNYKQQLK